MLVAARKANKIEMDYVYDWTIKASNKQLELDIPMKKEEKVEVVKVKEEKI